MHKKTILLPVILILSIFSLYAYTTVETTFEWKGGPKSFVFNETVTETPTGYIAVLETSDGEYDRHVMDSLRSVLEWERKDPADGTDIRAIRQGSKVTVTGTLKGKPYEKTHDFGTQVWYQLQEASYEELYRSGRGKGSFWTIDRKSLKASEFKVEKIEEENILIMRTQIPVVKYSLSVSGVPAFLFKAHFWLRKTDGRFLKLEIPAVLGFPLSTIELTSEKIF